MRQINEIIVHATATRPDFMAGNSLSGKVAEIRRWHVDRGWRDIGYHYLIDRDGTVAAGRPVDEAGAHVRGRNADSIGVALLGGFGGDANDPFREHFTAEQEVSLRSLLADLQDRYAIRQVSGHNEHAAKACPCFDVPRWLGIDDPREQRPTLRRGSRGRFVLDVQEQLVALGYPLGKPDGIYGPLTASAVREYQDANGLAADGIVGPRTWAALEAGGEPAPRRPDVTESELRKRGSETIKAADEGEAADRQAQREVGWLVGLLTALGASSEWLADGGPVAQVVLFVEDHWWVPVALGGMFLVYQIGRRKRLWGDIRFRRVVDAMTGAHRGR